MTTRPESLAVATKRMRGAALYSALLPLTLTPASSYLASFISSLSSKPVITDSHQIDAIYDQCTKTIWVKAENDMVTLWRKGFFGKGALSRSEPSWRKRVMNKIADAEGGVKTLTAEEVTAQRRKDRKITKLVKKAEREAEKLAAASASASKRGSMVGGTSPIALAASLPDLVEVEEDEDEGMNKLIDEEEVEEDEDEEAEAEAEAVALEEDEPEEPAPMIPEPAPPRWHLGAEHTQLQPEEAFFLSFALGALSLRSSNPLSLVPQPLSAPLSILQLWSTFLLNSATLRLDPAVDQSLTTLDPRLTRWDSPFLLSYVAYHHYRSMGWVIRSGVKFCADWVVYGPGGPVGSHAEFAVIVLPTYTDPADELSNPFGSNSVTSLRAEGDTRGSWRWFNTANRVTSGVKKTLVMLYVTVPALSSLPSPDFIMKNPAHAMSHFQVREITVRRWIAGRMRD